MNEYEEAILFSYALLESRLDRLEYILGADRPPPDHKPKTLPERIQRIERSLKQLSERTSLLNDVQKLISNHSDLLPSPIRRDIDEYADKDSDADADNGSPLTPAQKRTIVVERAPAFATTASQLKALDDQQVPQTDGFAKLAKLRPRIAEAEERHLQQALQISLLRRQSGLLVARYKQVHLVGQARCWTEWHKRVMDVDKGMVRLEFRLKQEGEGEGEGEGQGHGHGNEHQKEGDKEGDDDEEEDDESESESEEDEEDEL